MNILLKAVNHPTNSGGLQQLKLNCFFDIFCFDFGTAVAKIFNKYKKMSPRKRFLETLSFDLPAKTTVGLMV